MENNASNLTEKSINLKNKILKMNRKILLGGAILAVGIMILIVWVSSRTNAQTGTDLQTFRLEKGNLVESVLASGTVKSKNAVNIYSRAANYPIRAVNYAVGDKVKAGDILARLETSSLELDIHKMELTVKNTQENSLAGAALDLNSAKETLSQEKELYESGFSSQDEYLQAKLKLEKAQISYNTEKNTYDLQKIDLEKLRKELQDTIISSPINGTVTYANAAENNSAAGLLFVVEDTDHLLVATSIGESDIAKIKLGQEVIVRTDSTGEKEWLGTVSKIAPAVSKDANGNSLSSSNVKLDIEITLKNNDSNIKIGMKARCTIQLNVKKGIYYVPYDAIVREADGSQWIYVQETESNNSKNALKKILVQTGMETDMYVEVNAADLADNMVVVINPEI